MKKFLILLPMVAMLFIVSCKKNVTDDSTGLLLPEQPLSTTDQLRTNFTGILAKAIAHVGVRDVIRNEALKMFDNDYDVLLQLVKDREIQPGLSLIDYLSSLGLTDEMRNRLESELPLLTIMTPTLKNFSAASWNTASDIPLVAVINSGFNEKQRTPIPAFDYQGNTYRLKSYEPPAIPVIVVKENERMIAQPKSGPGQRTDKSNFVFGNQATDFYFLDDQFNRQKTGDPAITSKLDVNIFDVGILNKLTFAFSNKVPSQRDYVYYNIANASDSGKLNLLYAEYLCGITFSPGSENYLYDDYISDWADGMFEFQLDVLLFNGSSALNKISKVLAIPASTAYFSNGDNVAYKFPQPIQLATWDMKKYGDTWKYVLNELDAGVVTTINYSASTKIGSNYTFNSSTGEEYKVGTGFGSSVEQTFTNSINTQITQGSDFCGEAIVNYMTPVIIGPEIKRGSPPSNVYYMNELNTGIARMAVFPKQIQ